MKYEDAKNSVLGWVASDLARDIDDAQFDKLVQKLKYTVKDLGVVLTPEAVTVHAEQLFPELFEDGNQQQHGRVVPPRQQQPKQTREDVVKVLAAFFNSGDWSKVAPGMIPAVTTDAKIGSSINHAAFFGAVDARYARGELIRADFLSEIVLNLFMRGALEKYPAPVEVVPPPPPPSKEEQARELAKKIAAQERSLQSRDTSPIRGAKETAQPLVRTKPVLTEAQLQAKEAANRETDAIIAEAAHRISMFQGRNHARTFSGRVELNSVFTQAMDEGVEAKEVLRRLDAKIDQLAGSSSIR